MDSASQHQRERLGEIRDIMQQFRKIAVYFHTKKAAKAKARKKTKARVKAMLVVAQTRRLNAQVKVFLMKPLDDKHIRIMEGFDKAFDIYQAICDRYKGTEAYGDPYGIMTTSTTLATRKARTSRSLS
jgi:hypothetical protein